jgi:hypothetical protein
MEKQLGLHAILNGKGGNITLVNLDQVRLITEIREGHCKLVFSESHSIEISGTPADELYRYLEQSATVADANMSLREFLQTMKRASRPE